MLCIYHIADHDGKASGAIVKSVYPQISLLGLNNDMRIPREEIERHELVVVCDFALPVAYMFELSRKIDFVWIDHHASVINEYEALLAAGEKPIKGLRRIGTAASVLAWEYFYPGQKLPEGLELLGKHDVFDLRDPRVQPFEYAMQAHGQNMPDDAVWPELFAGRIDIDKMVDEGRRILDWINIRNYRLVRSMAFETEIDGLKCICANMPQGRSSFFDTYDNIAAYDVMINFYMNKDRRWNLSFYSARENVDVSKIAARFGGGGHKGAAGASALESLPDFIVKAVR